MCLHLRDTRLSPRDHCFPVPDVAHTFLGHGRIGPLRKVRQLLKTLPDGGREDLAVRQGVDAQQEWRNDYLFKAVISHAL
jgi:hypothetical protein